MKFSVVIPTRNRLEYLKMAITTVQSQDYDNWEIVIADNNSSQDIQGYIFSLKEPRIVYTKSDHFISVTENWNRAIDLASGEYIILIGDDDCLMQHSLSILNGLCNQFSTPELLFSNGLHYVYPGVFPWTPCGHLTTIGNWNLWDSEIPVLLKPNQLRQLVKESMNFRLRFSYNMQVLTIHKEFIRKLRVQNKFFHSPYPDFYAMTMLFQTATRAVACPYPLAIAGLSPKSYGGLFFNQQESSGFNELNIKEETNAYPELDKYIFPGSKLNTCWLYALRCAQKNLGTAFDLKINFARYRKLQFVECLSVLIEKPKQGNNFRNLFQLLSVKEKFKYGPCLAYIWLAGKIFGEEFIRITPKKILARIKRKLQIHPGHKNYTFQKEYSSILEVFNEITPHECKKHFKTL